VLVAACLEGWCFGLGPRELIEAREAGVAFGITGAPTSHDTAVERALGRLHGWWERSRAWPLEDVVESILDETGLLAHAAASDLGESRAGALVRLVAALREAAAVGSGIGALVDALEDVLAHAEGGAQLRPDRRDAVRVMNLHKAKGLEADIVVLAAPADRADHEPTVHVARSGDPSARSGLLIVGGDGVVAQPAGWDALAAREARFLDAERDRLLYVAATRARRELVVARLERRPTKKGESRESKALWKPFDAALRETGTVLVGSVEPAGGRARLPDAAADLGRRAAAVRARREAAGRATFSATSVTRSAKGEREERRSEDADWSPGAAESGQGRGRAWGSAVHRVLEGRGRGRTGEALSAFARAVAVDEGLAVGAAVELVSVAERVWGSDDGRRIAGAGERRFEWTVARAESSADGGQRLTEGVIDAAFCDGGSWCALDWKSDEVSDATWAERMGAHQAQVDLYATLLSTRTGKPAEGRIVRTAAAGAPARPQDRSE
jgi:ATP-dependent helicase/nuclease subunit A